MTYRGWTNCETWSVHSRVETDQRLHAARIAMLDGLGAPVTPDDVRRFFRDEMGGATPELFRKRATGEPVEEIDFAQLAAEWERERHFRLHLLGG